MNNLLRIVLAALMVSINVLLVTATFAGLYYIIAAWGWYLACCLLLFAPVAAWAFRNRIRDPRDNQKTNLLVERFQTQMTDDAISAAVAASPRQDMQSWLTDKRCINCREAFDSYEQIIGGDYTCCYHPNRPIRIVGQRYREQDWNAWHYPCCGVSLGLRPQDPNKIPGCVFGYHQSTNLTLYISCSPDVAPELFHKRHNPDLITRLEEYGFSVIVPPNPQDAGTFDTLPQDIAKADIVVFVLAKTGYQTPRLLSELRACATLSKTVLPFSVDKETPDGLRHLHIFRFPPYVGRTESGMIYAQRFHGEPARAALYRDRGQDWQEWIEEGVLMTIRNRGKYWRWKVGHVNNEPLHFENFSNVGKYARCVNCDEVFEVAEMPREFTCRFHPEAPVEDADTKDVPIGAIRSFRYPCCGRSGTGTTIPRIKEREGWDITGCVRGLHNAGDKPLFASYSREDKVVSSLVNIMRRCGGDFWQDLDDIEVGQMWEQEIGDIIRSCEAVVVFVSKNAKRSVWVEKELQMAKTAGVPILGVGLDKTVMKEVPFALVYRVRRGILWSSFSAGSDLHVDGTLLREAMAMYGEIVRWRKAKPQ